MTDLITFLTSEELLVVYTIVFFGGILCLVLYIAEKTYNKRNQKNNTKELNLLIEQMEEKIANIDGQSEDIEVIPNMDAISEQIEENPFEIKEKATAEIDHEPTEEIKYEDIEPDKTSAQAELEKLAESLINSSGDVVENIELTEFETEQEENAIISLDELLEKGNMLYEQNEVTQYKDEGNEPISIQDLEERMKQRKESVVEVEKQDILSTDKKQTTVAPTTIEINDTDKVSANTKAYQGSSNFKSSPIISPIYGIEKKVLSNKQNELELENTATFPKFDEEMRKTNEFIVTLKELQKKLD